MWFLFVLQVARAILENPHDTTKVYLIYANVSVDDILLKVKINLLSFNIVCLNIMFATDKFVIEKHVFETYYNLDSLYKWVWQFKEQRSGDLSIVITNMKFLFPLPVGAKFFLCTGRVSQHLRNDFGD